MHKIKPSQRLYFVNTFIAEVSIFLLTCPLYDLSTKLIFLETTCGVIYYSLLPDLENCQSCDKSHFFCFSGTLALKTFKSIKRNKEQAQHNQGETLVYTCV